MPFYLGSFDSILSATSAACVTADCCCGLHAWMSRIKLAASERTRWHDLVWSPLPRVYGIASRLSVLVRSPLRHAGNVWPLSWMLTLWLVHFDHRSVDSVKNSCAASVGAVGDDGLDDQDVPLVGVRCPNQLLAHRLPVTGLVDRCFVDLPHPQAVEVGQEVAVITHLRHGRMRRHPAGPHDRVEFVGGQERSGER